MIIVLLLTQEKYVLDLKNVLLFTTILQFNYFKREHS